MSEEVAADFEVLSVERGCSFSAAFGRCEVCSLPSLLLRRGAKGLGLACGRPPACVAGAGSGCAGATVGSVAPRQLRGDPAAATPEIGFSFSSLFFLP